MADSQEGVVESTHGHEFAFIGGACCLDFVNTLAWAAGDSPVEHLGSYRDLVEWGCQAEVLPADARAGLIRRAATMSGAAEDVLSRALALREALRRVMSAATEREAVDEAALAVLNGELSWALSRLRVDQADPGVYGWAWQRHGDGGEVELDYPLWPVARSAAELLISPRLGRVKVCQAPRCGWMFVDDSRNGSRRWCDSRDCGNRERVRRHYARRREAGR